METHRRFTARGRMIMSGIIVGAALIAALLIIPTRWGFGAEYPRLIPDPALTPGIVASTEQNDICGVVDGLTYSKRHRATTAEMKAEVRRLYGTKRCGEIDHRLPLSLGGADDIRNLWCQPGPPEPWDYHLKDALEVRVWLSVCHEHTMTLAEGQTIFLAPDWREPFCKIVGGEPCR